MWGYRSRENPKVQFALEHLAFQKMGFPVHNLDVVGGQAFPDALEEGGQEPLPVELGYADAELLLFIVAPVAHGLLQPLHLL